MSTELVDALRDHIQTFSVDLLVAIARGDVDAVAAARRELAARGLDLTGKWVGFPAAANNLPAPIHRHARQFMDEASKLLVEAEPESQAERDAFELGVAADAMRSNDHNHLRQVLARADTLQRERILAYVHPLHWADLGCAPIDLHKSLAEYATKFGPAAR